MSSTLTLHGLEAEQTDVAAREAAEAAIDGRISEAAARKNIAVLLSNSVAVDRAVAAYRSRHPTASSVTLDVVRAECEHLLSAKIEKTDLSSSFDLHRAAGASPVGWASQLLKSASARLAATVHRRVRESATEDIFEPLEGRWSSIAKSHANFTGAEKYLAAHSWLQQRKSTRSQSTREAEHAFAFLHAFNLPSPVRPHYRERRQVHRTIMERPQACWHAAATQFMAVGGTVNRRVDDDVDDRIAALWDDYTADQLQRLVLKDDRAAPLLGTVFTADFVRPSAAVTRKFVSAVARRTTRRTDKETLREAARALIEVEFSTSPLNLSTTQTPLQQRQAVQDDYISRAAGLFGAAAEVPGHPLGTDAEEVYACLYESVRSFTRERTITAGQQF